MKRCPQCGREYDNTMMFCLDDGAELLYGPASTDEFKTVMLPSPKGVNDETTALSGSLTSGASIRSIAVLPFAHLSNDPDDEYFCDGLTEELLNSLARIAGLKVAARTSSFSFREKAVTISEIGRALGVETVLEGSVRKSGDRLRISAKLINTADGYQLWSERYDREMLDIFDIQDDISLAVVEALKLTLLGHERSAVLQKGTAIPAAHECYLRGRALWNRRSIKDLKKAIEYFERAIGLDPKYALAYSGLADSYFSLAYIDANSPIDLEPKVRSAAKKAIELGPLLPESHCSLAAYRSFFEFNMVAGEKSIRTALSIKPNYLPGHYWLCSTLAAMGKHDESLVEGRIAMELDPLSPVVNTSMARALCCAGKFEEAIEITNYAFEVLPGFFLAHWFAGWAYEQLGVLETAIDHYRKAVKDGGLRMYAYLGKALVRAGQIDQARSLLAELERESELRFVSPLSAAVIHAELGEMPAAFRLLDEAWRVRAVHLMWARSDPIFEVFRTETRFQEFCRTIARTDEPAKWSNHTDETMP